MEEVRKLLAENGDHLVEFIYWWPAWEPHGHFHYFPFHPEDGIPGTAWETLATQLAEAVANCKEERHGGRGKTHSHEDVQAAFAGGVQQLAEKQDQYGWEYLELLNKMRLHDMWGGPVPTAVFLPMQDDPKNWRVIIPDANGHPNVHKIATQFLEDIIPPPTDSSIKGVPDNAGVGFLIPRRGGKS